jgi:hypothetical protein
MIAFKSFVQLAAGSFPQGVEHRSTAFERLVSLQAKGGARHPGM